MNKNYLKGRAKEYRIMKKYKDAGLTVMRTAGSHGVVDVIAIDPDNKKIYLIQAKPKLISKKAINRLLESNSNLNGSFECQYRVQ